MGDIIEMANEDVELLLKQHDTLGPNIEEVTLNFTEKLKKYIYTYALRWELK